MATLKNFCYVIIVIRNISFIYTVALVQRPIGFLIPSELNVFRWEIKTLKP
jgi:hypothetical protein